MSAPVDSRKSASRRPHLLVIEDDADIGKLLKEALEDEGYDISLSSDGEAALAWLNALRPARPEMILLDFVLPRMNGGEVLRRLGNDPALRSIPVVVMTAGWVGAQVPGASAVVRKPFSLMELFDAIRGALRSRPL